MSGAIPSARPVGRRAVHEVGGALRQERGEVVHLLGRPPRPQGASRTSALRLASRSPRPARVRSGGAAAITSRSTTTAIGRRPCPL